MDPLAQQAQQDIGGAKPAASETAWTATSWADCRGCGLMQRLPAPVPRHVRRCPRCHASFGGDGGRRDSGLALTITAFVLFLAANLLPLIGIEVAGRGQSIRLSSGVNGLANHGLVPLAVFVLAISIVAPLGRLLALGYVLLRLRGTARPRHLARLLRVAERMRPWSMLDVFLVGTLVALTKLQDLAAVDIGLGLWSLGLLVMSLAAVDIATDPGMLWDRFGPLPVPGVLPPPVDCVACLACRLLQEPAPHCLRCHATLHRRKPSSQSRAAALVMTGLVLYLPANLYPVLTVVSFGRGASATILGGVSELMNGSDWPLAIIVFTASIAVPLLKLVGLGWLLLSTRLGLRRRLADRTRLYRLIELVSRWSAVDIFVAALLTALVTLGNLATIEPGLGVLAFGAVVFVTMLATESFDTRVMWDAAGANDA